MLPLIITIPSKGRVGRIKTLEVLPASWKELIYVFTPAEEIEAHRREPYVSRVAGFVADRKPGITGSWQTQFDFAAENGIEWMWMFEDDVYRIDYWPDLERYESRRANEAKIEEMAELFLDLFERERIAMVGLLNRGASKQKFPVPLEYAVRIHGVWAVNVPTLLKIGFRFDEFGPDFYQADFHLQLRLLESGYRSVRVQTFNWDQGRSNSPGGASDTRNAETQRRSSEILAREHPLTVKLRSVRSKKWGAGNGDLAERVDVTVRWKKALSNVGELNRPVALTSVAARYSS
jgi:hypothetical protein